MAATRAGLTVQHADAILTQAQSLGFGFLRQALTLLCCWQALGRLQPNTLLWELRGSLGDPTALFGRWLHISLALSLVCQAGTCSCWLPLHAWCSLLQGHLSLVLLQGHTHSFWRWLLLQLLLPFPGQEGPCCAPRPAPGPRCPLSMQLHLPLLPGSFQLLGQEV